MEIWELNLSYNHKSLLYIFRSITLVYILVAGIDGPAAFMSADTSDQGTKVQILSVNQSHTSPQSQSQSQPQTQPQSPEEPEKDSDTETLLEPKTDIHELLQKQGESCPVLHEAWSFPSFQVEWQSLWLPYSNSIEFPCSFHVWRFSPHTLVSSHSQKMCKITS